MMAFFFFYPLPALAKCNGNKKWFPCSSTAKAEVAEVGCKCTLEQENSSVAIYTKEVYVQMSVMDSRA